MLTRTSLLLTLIVLASCKKESVDPVANGTGTFTNASVLSAFTSNVAVANYDDLAARTSSLREAVGMFASSHSEDDLASCKQRWRDARQAWERSEGMLFGPVSTENIDPRIDTWPVNFTDLDAQLNSSNAFTADYISGLEDALKGFHPIEYLLFGQNGDKTAAQMTARQEEYLIALCDNVVALTTHLAARWDPAESDNYSGTFLTAGAGNNTYPTQRAAFEELVNAMRAICDEVANGKMTEPLLAQDPALEESPFAKNSTIDFTDNIRSVENVYLGRYTTDGIGLEDFVRQYDLQLDGLIKQRIAASISALGTITVPFGEAISTQQVQVEQAIEAINALADVLGTQLLPLVQQHTN